MKYTRSFSLVLKTLIAVLLLPIGWPAEASAQGLAVQKVAGGLSTPIFVTAPEGDNSRLFIAEQGSGGTAKIKIVNLADNSTDTTPFLTLSGISTGGERGILGFAFDPDYATSGKFYVDYTDSSGNTRVDRFTVSADPNVANSTGTNVLTITQPQANHNGGWIGFSSRPGDEGNLYIATGDGGNSNDQGAGHNEPGGNAQDTDSMLGKMLRINVDTLAPGTTHPEYSIPANSPFGNEVFDYGLRNPFRDSFDSATGNLIIADVGQGAREEIDVQKATNSGGGENYGWRLREGNIETPGGSPPVGGNFPANYVAPVFDYPHTVGQTIIGGYVYHGHAVPSLDGTYIFGDYLGPNTGGGTSRIFSLQITGDTAGQFTDITNLLFDGAGKPTLHNVYSFGEDARGELYIVDGTGGAVYRLVPEPSSLLLLALGAGACWLARARSKQSR